MAISGKVTAATVAASLTTVISGIVAPHVFGHSTPSDVRGLIEGGVSAVVTFAAGYLAKHGIDPDKLVGDVVDVAEDLGVPFSTLSESDEPVIAAGPGSVAVGGSITGSVVTASPLV